jgi:hypothetical protein
MLKALRAGFLILFAFWIFPARACDPNEECSKCLLSIFGHCKQRGNDPACEIRKKACQAGQSAGAEVGGDALAAWINGSRNTAINTSQPIPPQIRQALTGYIANNVMDRARFKVGDNGILNLAGLTVRNFGDVSAVTVNDVIVFRNAADAYNNPSLWAHELTHVQQYMEWGVHTFAVRYVRNYHDVEDHAYAVGNGYANWRASQQSYPQPSQQVGYFCNTPYGRYGPVPANLVGTPCSLTTPYGATLYGQVVQ